VFFFRYKAGRSARRSSGRAADAIVSLWHNTPASDGEVLSLRARAAKTVITRRPELFQIAELEGGATGLRDAIVGVIGSH